MLKLLQQQQRQQQHPTQQLQSAQIPQIPMHANLAAAMAPQGAFLQYPMSGVPYMPFQMPQIQAVPTMQGMPAAQPIYTVPQVFSTIPPPVGFQPKWEVRVAFMRNTHFFWEFKILWQLNSENSRNSRN